MHAPGKLVSAACADDGSAYVAVGAQGEIWRLAPDLHSRWERSVPHPVTALALDPFGQYLAVADAGSNLSLFDCQGRPGVHFQSPRSLYHLAFVPTAPYILAGSDYGLAACFDVKGKLVWRDGLVAHIGSLTVSGSGESMILAWPRSVRITGSWNAIPNAKMRVIINDRYSLTFGRRAISASPGSPSC